MRVLLVRATLAAVLLAPAACAGGGDAGSPVDPPPVNDPPVTNPPASQSTVDTVRLTAGSFEPANLTVRPGRTVVWVNTLAMVHTVTPDGHTQWANRTTSAPGEVLRVTFNGTGTFPYYCDPHRSSGMTGRITVQP